jgi:predicted membrane GTPase involved in stress response
MVPSHLVQADWFGRAKTLLGENPRYALTQKDDRFILEAVWEPDLELAFDLLHRQNPEIRASGYDVIYIWNPELQEPYLHLRINCPEEYMGKVFGDLNRRLACLLPSSGLGSDRIFQAEVPAAELFGYSVDIRAMTKSQATVTAEFIGYRPAPTSTQPPDPKLVA